MESERRKEAGAAPGRAEVQDAQEALDLVDDLGLDRCHVFLAVRAGLLRRLGRGDEAARAYESAITRTENQAERGFLRRAADRAREGARGPGTAKEQ